MTLSPALSSWNLIMDQFNLIMKLGCSFLGPDQIKNRMGREGHGQRLEPRLIERKPLEVVVGMAQNQNPYEVSEPRDYKLLLSCRYQTSGLLCLKKNQFQVLEILPSPHLTVIFLITWYDLVKYQHNSPAGVKLLHITFSPTCSPLTVQEFGFSSYPSLLFFTSIVASSITLFSFSPKWILWVTFI